MKKVKFFIGNVFSIEKEINDFSISINKSVY